MARIIYALSGQGRGHASRVIAISDELKKSGHEILFCCGGISKQVLESRGERVLSVPALRHQVDGNKLRPLHTLYRNFQYIINRRKIISRLTVQFAAFKPDLLITDFEAFSSRAARHLKVPVITLDHQHIVTETKYTLPPHSWIDAVVTAFTIKLIAPKKPEHILISSFFYPPLKKPHRTTLIPPIIRRAVQNITPRRGEHVVVYFNQSEGTGQFLETLSKIKKHFVIYNFSSPSRTNHHTNLEFKQPSIDGFLRDLATCHSVICTAGFTLISEVLYLGKPALVMPNGGILEQTLNAIFLQQAGLGAAVIDRSVTVQDIQTFLDTCPVFEARLRSYNACGNEDAIMYIQRILANIKPTLFPKAAVPRRKTVKVPVPAQLAKPWIAPA
jgi:uncharacterized protein (TIGR00661 family)